MYKYRMLSVCKRCPSLKWAINLWNQDQEQWQLERDEKDSYTVTGKSVLINFGCGEANEEPSMNEDGFEGCALPNECILKLEHTVLLQKKQGSLEWKDIEPIIAEEVEECSSTTTTTKSNPQKTK